MMKIKQFFDEGLAHSSYAIASEGEVALIDPGRNPQPYLDFAAEHHSSIVAVFETHLHADFISSHREFQEKHQVRVYIHEKADALYPHTALNHADEVSVGEVTFRAIYTPGHSPDHNTYLLLDEEDQPHALFTGDTLFVGDIGRPDLREENGELSEKQESLAKQMYQTIHRIFKPMENHLLVYPAHGAGSLCGNNISSEPFSTLGAEKEENWAFQPSDESVFISKLLDRQSFIPGYFAYDVEINRQGAAAFQESIASVPVISSDQELESEITRVDIRDENRFKEGHLPGSLNIQVEGKFETWLGTIVSPRVPFYLLAENEKQLHLAIRKTAKIGYEGFIRGGLFVPDHSLLPSPRLDLEHFREYKDAYSIVDVRNRSEYEDEKVFSQAKNIPLAELNARTDEVDPNKPVVVHCSSGYRSAIGASLLKRELPQRTVYDLSDTIKEFKSEED